MLTFGMHKPRVCCVRVFLDICIPNFILEISDNAKNAEKLGDCPLSRGSSQQTGPEKSVHSPE
jgi:hypothetical protein